MGLPAAIKAHRDGDLKNAAHHYSRALKQHDNKAILFQNYGALLREIGEVDKSEAIYRKGLSHHPKNRPIRLNFANLIKDSRPLEAFPIYLELLKEKLSSQSDPIEVVDITPLIDILDSQQFNYWCYQICLWSLSVLGPEPKLLLQVFKLSLSADFALFSEKDSEKLLEVLKNVISTLDKVDQAEFHFALMALYLSKKEYTLSLRSLYEARSILQSIEITDPTLYDRVQKLNNANSWNMGCTLLTHQIFDEGWKLFEYGLRTKAAGAQKWQRALPKPFTGKECPVWRGQTLRGKSLLLLEEQAIGDAMQFLTLLPTIVDEATHVGILISPRLIPVYKRSLGNLLSVNKVSLWSFDDIAKLRDNVTAFDYQSPLGSICQYRFTDIKSYGLFTPSLKADTSLSTKLRKRYLSGSPSGTRLIGVSWRGGGRVDRIKQKSIDVNEFGQLMLSVDNIRFVNLQYGDTRSFIDQWIKDGIDIIHDDRINPLKDLDKWHAQVAACDAVVSVANTTIHGAGGLNIPTQCLLSQESDWRWLKDSYVQRSYWYPSVGIARQSKDGNWKNAVQLVRDWLLKGAPMPDGPQHIKGT